MPSAKGKPPTREKEKEAQYAMKLNAQTPYVYRNFALVGSCARLLLSIAISGVKPTINSLISKESFLSHMGIPIIVIFMYCFMKLLSSPMYSEALERKLASPGYDLNLQGGWDEYLQHFFGYLVILHILSAISPLVWLIVPLTGLCVSWNYVIRPFLTIMFMLGSVPENIELGIKAKKKVKKIKYQRSIRHWHHFK